MVAGSDRWDHWGSTWRGVRAGRRFLDHVSIYGLAMFVLCVCVCACGVHVCLSWCSTIFAFELAARPSHPLRYEHFLSPFPGSCDNPHGGAAHCRIVCLLLVSVLVCFRFLLN